MNKYISGEQELNVLYNFADKERAKGFWDIDECYNFIKKELKALDIIKENPRKIVFLCSSDSYEECSQMMNTFEINFDFPKQEYDLLKEVLL